MPLVVACEFADTQLEELLRAAVLLPGRFVISKDADHNRPAALVDAVRLRPLPAVSTFAEHIAKRLDDPRLGEKLTELFAAAVGQKEAGSLKHPSTYSRFFSSRGPYTRQNWQALAVLLHEIHSLRSGSSRDVSMMRSERHVSLQTLVRYARKYLRLSWGEAAAGLVGWECVVERYLRVGGYVTLSGDGQECASNTTF